MTMKNKNVKKINKTGYEDIIFTEKNQKIHFVISDFSSHSSHYHCNIRLKGDHSNIILIGRMHGKKKEKKQWNISLFLEGKNQSAVIDIKGVAEDESVLECNAGGILTQTSKNAQITISEKIFLFSEKSQAQVTPLLRVETENVSSASHSASIAPFDEEIFFFLESRGISTEIGKILLKTGILSEIV